MISTMFSWTAFAAIFAFFGLIFVLLFVLSLFPKGRRVANGFFKFPETTKLGKFRSKVEGELTSINKRLDNIEAILKTLVGGGIDHAKSNHVQKAKQKEDRKGRKIK